MKAFLALLFMLPVLAACNTIQGVGQDIENVGDALEEATKSED